MEKEKKKKRLEVSVSKAVEPARWVMIDEGKRGWKHPCAETCNLRRKKEKITKAYATLLLAGVVNRRINEDCSSVDV
jgi:hypothetical protein